MELPGLKGNDAYFNFNKYRWLFIIIITCGYSCAVPKNFPVNYYQNNKEQLETVEQQYSKLYSFKPFSAAFTDKEFDHVSLEMKTDTLRYIYEFNLYEKEIRDSLTRFGYDTSGIMNVLRQMQSLKCTWINKLDYYVDGNRRQLTFLSIRHKSMDVPFSSKKYVILTFYQQPQYYDSDGKLLDKRSIRRLRRINNEEFIRITDKVCYTLSSHFR